MLYTITRPADAPGPHLLTLNVLGGRFAFERGTSHDLELDPEADALLVSELRRDGYSVEESAPVQKAPEAAASGRRQHDTPHEEEV